MPDRTLSFPGFSLLAPPYRVVEAVEPATLLHRPFSESRGCALIWSLGDRLRAADFEVAFNRTPGMALTLILPPAERIESRSELLRVMERCRPQTVLPYHDQPDAEDLAECLRRPPADLAVEVTDYLRWRGLEIDLETRRLVRRTLALSGEVTTVSGLARALYLSRRALGRRFLRSGLPVPSHWLQFGRLLRAAIQLQQGQQSLFAVACQIGYPDGFALSNQMRRLCGVRPSFVRECRGWEWIVETWLQMEAAEGNVGALREWSFPRTHSVVKRVAEVGVTLAPE